MQKCEKWFMLALIIPVVCGQAQVAQVCQKDIDLSCLTNLTTHSGVSPKGIALTNNWHMQVSATGSSTVLSQSTFSLTATFPSNDNDGPNSNQRWVEWVVAGPDGSPWKVSPVDNTHCDITGCPPIGSSHGLTRWVTALVLDQDNNISLFFQGPKAVNCAPLIFHSLHNQISQDQNGVFWVAFLPVGLKANYPSGLDDMTVLTVQLDRAFPNTGGSIALGTNGVLIKDPPQTAVGSNTYDLKRDNSGKWNEVFWEPKLRVAISPLGEDTPGLHLKKVTLLSATLTIQ